MRAVVVEVFDEIIELCLLLEEVGTSGTCGFLFEGQCIRSGRPFCWRWPGLVRSMLIPRGSLIGDGQRVAIALVSEHELALIVGRPELVRTERFRKRRALGAGSRSDPPAYQPVTIQHGWCWGPEL